MSTEYIIELGYMSGHSYSGPREHAWRELLAVVQGLVVDPQSIVDEARRLGAPERCSKGCCTLATCAEAYARKEDGSLVINEDDWYIVQLTTGDRGLKEHIRRAFCRLVIEHMHRKGIEVNLSVS